MPKYRVTATMDVGYEAIVEAPDEQTAWDIAGCKSWAENAIGWVQVDEGHDWTLEGISEIDNE